MRRGPRPTAAGAPAARPLAALCATLAACGAGDERAAASLHGAPEEPAARDTVFVSADWLSERAATGDVLVVHIGSTQEYETRRIAGARLVTTADLNEERDGIPNMLAPAQRLQRAFEAAGVTGEERVVVYGAPLQAARAFVALERLGHPRASILDGGLGAWLASGGATETGPTPQTGSAVAARLQHDDELVVDAEWVRQRLGDANYAIIDARPPAEHRGETDADRVPRPGRIPGSTSLFWEQLIASRDRPLLRADAELYALFEAAGAQVDRTVVTYCRTGMQSSFAYAVARHLGYRTRLYDGSFVDWSRRRELPVER